MTYALGVQCAFPAKHYLVGGDFGPEGAPHSHDYRIELTLESPGLDEHGFVADIVDVRAALKRLESRYRDRMLNDFPEFQGVNPGCEAFARVVAEFLRDGLPTRGLASLTVKIWESEEAWASCRLEVANTE